MKKELIEKVKRWMLYRKIEIETMIGDSIIVEILEKAETEIMIAIFKLKAIIFSIVEIETMIADTKVKAIIVEMKERLRRWASSWPPFWCE
jgi:hypothetical protein